LRLAGLATLEFAWTAKLVVGVLALFNLAIFAAPESPTALKVIMPLLTVAAVVVLRRLSVQPQKRWQPGFDGASVGSDEAPALWALARRARAHAGGARVHALRVADGAERSLVREGRGHGGGSRRVLGVGFALIAACSPDELESLIAMAMRRERGARLFDATARIGDVYWRRLAIAEQGGALRFLSRPFYRWFAQRFTDEVARLSTNRVLAGDDAVARATGPDVVARALAKQRIVAEFLQEEFWIAIWARTESQPNPPEEAHTRMAGELAALGQNPAAWRWLTAGIELETEFVPSLRRRLTALGTSDDALDPAALFRSGVHGVAADELDRLSRILGERWAQIVAEEWRVQHGEHELARDDLHRFDEEHSADALDEESLASYAPLIKRFRGPEAALEYYERAAAAQPTDPFAQFHLGRLRLYAGDERGLGNLEWAIELDLDALIPACAIAERYLRSAGRPVEADAYAARAADYSQRRAEANRVAARLDDQDVLEPHGLAPASIAAIRDRARQLRNVNAIFLARKPVPGFPDEDRYVAIALRRRGALERRDANHRLARVLNESVPFPEGTTVWATTVEDKAWQPFSLVAGAEVYRRNWRATVKWSYVFLIASVLALYMGNGAPGDGRQLALKVAIFVLVLGGAAIGFYLNDRDAQAQKNASGEH